MLKDILYISLIVFAILSIQTPVLRQAIIYLSVFSLLCSVAYLLQGAPDVAIAEAAIGCTLSTILFLVALKKYSIFTVYLNSYSIDSKTYEALEEERDKIQEQLQSFCRSSELQLDLIHTSSSFKHLKNTGNYDVILFHTNKGIWMHGLKNNYQYNEVIAYLKKNLSLPIHEFYISEESEIETIESSSLEEE
ncbi:MAG: DUF4040 domain-containing protein [Vallitaleaceae bacterium]|nr:DUF4040 domain-containing protein [Vallitaleaceae bacterium]